MAKLNQETAKSVAEASDSFEPIPAGTYHVRLKDVDSSRSGKAGPYWSWEFEGLEGEAKGRKLWNNTSLSTQSQFALKQTFDAFGVPYDTDTDDLLGRVCKLTVSIRTIQAGARKGELANQVDRVHPADTDFEAPTVEGSPEPEDIFG